MIKHWVHACSMLVANLLATRWVASLVLACAAGALTAFGIIGIGRDGTFLSDSNFDMWYLYAAGKAWWARISPYDAAAFLEGVDLEGIFRGEERPSDVVFAYPPQAAPLAMLLATLSLRQAAVAMAALNLLSTLGLVASIAWLARRPGENTRDVIGATRTWYIAAIVVGNPFTAHVFWMGQTSLIASAAIAGSFVAWRHDRVWIAGLLLAVATLKPQLALLPFGWIVFAGRGPRTALVSLAAAGLLSLWPIIVSGGPIALAAEWLGAVERYQFDPFNQIAFEKMFGVRSLFAVVFGDAPSMLPLGIMGLAMLIWFRSRLNTAEALALLAVLTVSFVYAHDYDLVLLTVAAAPLAYLLEERPALRLWVLGGLLALMLPQRFLRGFESPILFEYREVLVLALGALIVAEVRWRHATAPPRSVPDSAT